MLENNCKYIIRGHEGQRLLLNTDFGISVWNTKRVEQLCLQLQSETDFSNIKPENNSNNSNHQGRFSTEL